MKGERRTLIVIALALAAMLLSGCAGFDTAIVVEHEKYGQVSYRLPNPRGLSK